MSLATETALMRVDDAIRGFALSMGRTDLAAQKRRSQQGSPTQS
ncbi:hypothetical protein [Thermoleptolyngbya sp. C42_A2020_037]|nr:hypothetical protein [Thermoleptolyngbya sp. C42_A2020_037]